MAPEQSKSPELRVRRLVELRWQREVITRWLAGFGSPAESRSQLEEMLAQVNAELEALEGTPARDPNAEQIDERGLDS